MEPKEVVDMIGMGTLVFAIGSYLLKKVTDYGLDILNVVGSFKDKPINSQEELELVVREEANKLDMQIPDRIIFDGSIENSEFIDFIYEGHRTRATEYSNGIKEIVIEHGKGRKAVRHELYHLYKDHLKNRGLLSPFYSTFIAEPQSILYGNFGIRL